MGNDNSTVASLINKLQNSDWVKKGLDYLPEAVDDSGKPCPFCQKNTITKAVVSSIREYFDETYERDLNALQALISDYETASSVMQSNETYGHHPFVLERKSEFRNKYDKVTRILGENKRKLEDKTKTPSQKILLES
jgi:wobble nucleotide-excising tRNase